MYPLWTNTTEVQPHVRLDAVLATLSLGPVGISDGYNMTDVGLIGQAYRSVTDGTLLRPSRPLSTLDSALLNHSSSGGRAPCTALHGAMHHARRSRRHAGALCVDCGLRFCYSCTSSY